MDFEIPKTNWMWIPDWTPTDAAAPMLIYFRKSFIASQDELKESDENEKFLLKISADTRYKLFVNGKLIQIGPSRGNGEVWFYDSVSLSGFLQEGENVLAAEVLRYPENQSLGNHGMFRTHMPGLYIRAEGCPILESGWKCRRDDGFKIVSESYYFAPLQVMEERRGEEENKGWKEAHYGDGDWLDARRYLFHEVSLAVSPGNIKPRTIPVMKLDPAVFGGFVCLRDERGNPLPETVPEALTYRAEVENLLRGQGCVRIPAGETRRIEITAGEEMTGYLSLRMAKGRGSRIDLLCSEAYIVKGTDIPTITNPSGAPKKKDRCDFVSGILKGFTDTFFPAGYGTKENPEVYEPFWFRTFRFVQLCIQAGEEDVILTGFDYLETGYPLAPKSFAETSDATLAPIWDISLRTLKRCMHETYEDCPFYEQLQYAMDSRSEILYTYAVSADDRLARKCMDDFRKSQRSDGMINCSYPNYGPNIIPGFSIYYICMLWDHMMYFGDKEFLRQHMGCVDGILEYFRRNLDERGLVGKNGGLNGHEAYWSFIDWTLAWNETTGMPCAGLQGPITMESFLYILGLMKAADVLEYLGRGETAQEYRERAKALRKAVNTFCRDGEGVYTDGPGVLEYSQHCQVFALLTDTCDVMDGRNNILKSLADPDRFAPCSVAMAFYLFRALEKADLYEETDRLWDLWRTMVRNHLSTCVEDGLRERSDCHAWGALALYELPSVILGVRPAAPGYEVIAIKPVPGKLTWAKGRAVTKWGDVEVSWKKKEDGTLDLNYIVPKGVKVEVLKGSQEKAVQK